VLVGGSAVFVNGTGEEVSVGDGGGDVSVGPGDVGDGGVEVGVGAVDAGDGGGEVSVGPARVADGPIAGVRVAVGAAVLEGVALAGRVPVTVGPPVGKMSNACWLAVGSPLGGAGGDVSGSGLPLA
jgi:hypothetical protein